MKKYITPEMDITEFKAKDIIATSADVGYDVYGEDAGDDI